ncbi:heterokaryon incompatibility protein-domain-containing protein [Xylogone sp. PMI_703]|nr:heterokaryon incompatibility protein-domain-containing protein [Xylogone sp. PMI_703]
MSLSSRPALQQPSLVVKLPYSYCTKCTDILQRWCEPVKPFDYASGWMNSFGYTIDAESFLRKAGSDETAQWMWFIGDLKASARHCHCCSFIMKTLNASPWMVYEDEDFIILKSQLVGSKHSDTLATPQERDRYDSQLEYGNGPVKAYSKYHRYYRPMIKLYRKREGERDQFGSHIAGRSTFVLPLANSDHTSLSNELDSQTFHGRLVGAEVDILLIQEWFHTCKAKHIKSNTSPNLCISREESKEDCVPKLRRKIPHFRLIDVKNRCVILAQDEDEYAALSYVWGHAKRLILTIENLERLSTPGALSFDREEVPRTFKDALSVAERLNIAFLWIDALCVLQDDEDQLVEHMNVMDSIYGSAVLTIVSDADSADSGIPGISLHRGPPQVVFKHGSETYISAKRTFGQALNDSFWESRAWCLQEKVFSKRLLIFTDSQAFYHCTSTTWFEDTIMELREDNYGSVSIAERESSFSKRPRQPRYTAYEAHRKLLGRNFWSLIEGYTQRQLSFEKDSIRAFSGILKSMESKYGPAHWGVPEYYFARGLTWSQSQHKLEHHRPQFPSWSWASWRGNTGSEIHFGNMLTWGSDIWNIDWHFYKLDQQTGAYKLTPMKGSYERPWSVEEPVIRRPEHVSGPKKTFKPELLEADERRTTPLPEPLSYFSDVEPAGNWQTRDELFKEREQLGHVWALPGHPGEEDYVHLEMPTFEHDLRIMPPPSHIIRFFTSCAKLFIDTEPDLEYHKQYHPLAKDRYQNYYRFRLLSTKTIIGHVQLDPAWEGKGKEQEFIYISPSFWPPSDDDMGSPPTIIWIMLIEGFSGASEVKRRVQLCGPLDISTWRLAEPVWKCVTLA